MYSAISPWAVGIKAATLDEAIEAARAGGFDGVEIDARQIVDLPAGEAAQRIAGAGLRAAGFALPMDFRGEQDAFDSQIRTLPGLVRAAADAGARRCFTWIMPCCDQRAMAENWRFHVERLCPIAGILAAFDCRLGLEFIGPVTLRKSRKFPFIFTMRQMLDLAADVGENVGLLVDSFHWYTSRGTLDDLRRLKAEQVVYVHVNDAPAGVAIDEQLDNVRDLPGATGMIDMGDFLGALAEIQYDGPVVPEPFSRRLNEMASDRERARIAGEAMRKVFSLAGL